MKSIGTVGFRDREKWRPNTRYRKDDRISHNRSTLYAKEDHESGEEFDPEKWGYLLDGRGVTEAIEEAQLQAQAATEAAETATEAAGNANAEAEAARKAAILANSGAIAAHEARGILTENIKLTNSDEFIYAIVDLYGTMLWGIRKDGTVYQPKGIPEETKKALSALNGFEIVETSEYLLAIGDSDGNLVFAIDRNGASHVNAIKGVCTVEQFESQDFILAFTDSADNLLFGVRKDGTFETSKFSLPPEVQKQISKASAGFTTIDEGDGEFIYKVTDKEGLILFAVRWDGTIYAPKGIPEEQKKENRRLNRRIEELEKGLANFSGGTGDWSEQTRLHLPRPLVPARVEITGQIPTSKYTSVPAVLKYNDMMGNSFTKPILWNVQGNISANFDKKNFAIDLLNSPDEDDSFEVKFGNWVPQDSFHLKAYISDLWKIRSLGVYRHAEEISQSRPYFNRRPWNIIGKGAKQSVEDVLDQGGIGKVTEDMETGALGRPDGFAVMLYINGTPWGLYTWNLKKHKDNYCITKNDNDGLQLFFGDYMTGVFNHYNNTYWGITNYDLRKLEGDGATRSISIPSYSSASGTQLVMESAGTDGMTLEIANSNKTYSYPVYYNGEPVTAQNTWEAGDCVTVKRGGESDSYYFDVRPLCKKWDDKRGYAVDEYAYDEDTIDFKANGTTASITIRRLFRLTNTTAGFAGYEYDEEGYPCTLLYRTNAEGEEETYRSGRITLYRTMRPSYINWRLLEVRNPKKTICVAFDGLDEEGNPKLKFEYYDYDSPNDYAQTGYYERTHEIISEEIVEQGDITKLQGTGESSSFSKKEYTRSCNTRKTLETYSFVGPIMDMTIPQTCLEAWGFETEAEAKKAIFAEHHDTDHNIDFFLVYNDMYYIDSITHNTLYTMYDGKKVFANLYDTDISMGMGSTYINSFPSFVSTVATTAHTFVWYLWKYFADEIKVRWSELRSMGVISAERFEKMVWGMTDEIGASAYEEEARLWSQPAYRAPVYWRMVCGGIQILEDDEGLPYHGYDETLNTEVDGHPTWSEGIAVSVNDTYNYEGHSYICTVAHTTSAGTRPDKAYTCGSPSSGGVKDSPRRIIEWFKKRISALDTAFEYVAPVSLSDAVAINESTINNIINQ